MKNLNADLKSGELKQVYLLFGEENYLKKQYKKRLSKAILPENDGMNYAIYEGKGIDIGEVTALADTMPFFSERRLIVLENSGFFKSGGAELAEYIKRMPDTTYMLFVEEEVDKRGKLYKTVQTAGRVCEMKIQDEKTLKLWVASCIKKENKSVSEHTILHFLNKVGTNMDNISRELEKIFCYTFGRDVITEVDVDAVCTIQITGHIFDMVDAVALKQQQKAMELYGELLAMKEPPMRILFMLTRQYRNLFHIKDLLSRGCAKNEIASKSGLHPYAANKCISQAKQFSIQELRKILEEGAELDYQVKQGFLSDKLAVELFIVRQINYNRQTEE